MKIQAFTKTGKKEIILTDAQVLDFANSGDLQAKKHILKKEMKKTNTLPELISVLEKWL